MQNNLIHSHHATLRQLICACLQTLLPTTSLPQCPRRNPSETWILSCHSPTTRGKSFSLAPFSLGKCPRIPVPCSQPLLCHVATSLVLSYVLVHHPSQFPPLPHWTTSRTLSLAGIFLLPLCMSGELPSHHTLSLGSPLSHHPWSPRPSSSCCCFNRIPLSFCTLLCMSPQPNWGNRRVEILS